MWRDIVRRGCVIPAHPLALTAERKLDERRQRALTRYYLAAGAGGVAVAVHTTQFEIRDPQIGLLEPVLSLAAAEMDGRNVVKIAGVVGRTPQAVKEAELAARLGYHAGLLSLGALKDATIDQLLDHVRAVARVIPVFGFYLQPAVGGRILPYEFWRRFAEIENVVGIKVAPFNRYQTLDVARALADAGSSIPIYTGNDDNIIADLLTTFRFNGRKLRIVGGLLGHWAVWTRRAVEQLEKIHAATASEAPLAADWLTLSAEITDANAAFFDPAHAFHGCIAGIHEVLRRQGLLEGRWCLNPQEELSAGQMEEIDRVYAAYPHLSDDAFVRENLDSWLR
ncbi:MAG: dihydrodipicolinate synthase family protein [Bryobacterales bacterium]|nr:dihydrodipicolinate synthase family protein [Bryobacterales bacterium]